MTTPYLCQVSQGVSCGACCGLYNVRDLTRAGLEALLNERTDAFARVPRTPEAIDDFGRRQLGWTPPERPFPHFHHCPFVGLIGGQRTRVGCMLHPDEPGNDDRDWRELSYYGAKACRTYLCPTTRMLNPAHQFIICQGFDHWYLYGLIVTEHRLWSAFFRELECRFGRAVTWEDFKGRPKAKRWLGSFAALKLDWPFRPKGAPGPCHFFFDDDSYPRREVERADAAIPASPYEAIFLELESRFMNIEEMQQAETMVATIFDELASVVLDKQKR